MEKQDKQIKVVFPEYTSSKSIAEGIIKKINIFKKSNRLELTIGTKTYIKLKEILEFENYLKTRFQIEKVDINIEYDEYTLIPKLEEQWVEIVKYMGQKYPTTKMLLKNTKLEFANNKLLVILPSKGAEFLVKRNFDKLLEELIYRIDKERYKVEYVERIDQEAIKKYEENAKLAEKLAIEIAQQQMYADAENLDARRNMQS